MRVATKLYFPVPPSANELFFNLPGRGRAKTAKYKKWIKAADVYMLAQKPLPSFRGKLALHITVPLKTRGDTSNRIKAIEDYLVRVSVTEDDRHNWKVCCQKQGVECYVEIVVDSQPDMG